MPPALDQLPYYALQVVGTFLQIDDRYALAACSRQLADAIDTDLVWAIGGNNDEAQFFSRICKAVESVLPDPNARQGNPNYAATRVTATCVRPLTKEQQEKRVAHLIDVLAARLPPSFRCSWSKEHQRFRCLAVAATIPRTVAFLDNSELGGPYRARELSNPVRFLINNFGNFSNKELEDQMESVFSPDALSWWFDKEEKTTAASNSNNSSGSKEGKKNRWLRKWCLAVNSHAHEVMRGVDSLSELRFSLIGVSIGNTIALAVYAYATAISIVMRASYSVFNYFNWTRQRFARWLIENKVNFIGVEEFKVFPMRLRGLRESTANLLREHYQQDPLRVVTPSSLEIAVGHSIRAIDSQVMWETVETTTMATKDEFLKARLAIQHKICDALAASAKAGATVLLSRDEETLRRCADKGLTGGVPLLAIVVQCLSFGTAAAFSGGRAPSIHTVPAGFAAKVNLGYKVAFEILRTSLHHNVDALLFFVWTRVVMLTLAVPYAVKSVKFTISHSRPAILYRLLRKVFLETPYQFIVPSSVRNLISGTRAAVALAKETYIHSPIRRWITQPIARALSVVYDNVFGQLNGAAALSFVSSTAISTAVTLIYESNRYSWRRTVPGQGFRSTPTFVSHALFAASLVMLRWKLYSGGAGFWKVTAVESAVRIGVVLVEAIVARWTYAPPKKHPHEEDDDVGQD